jgi:hypothetical protein
MKPLLPLLIVVSLFIVSFRANAREADNVRLHGQITDSLTNEALVGAIIFLQGTQKGAATGVDGAYSLELEPGTYMLEIKYMGTFPKNLR